MHKSLHVLPCAVVMFLIPFETPYMVRITSGSKTLSATKIIEENLSSGG